ncbi:MAG: FadR/GntR family transcriptional regulator [Candidatus Latescibacterota bacterium]|nr:FadR/GntR family transcriptional regulator [Candidatus Latescibacterota bacterium]
MNNASIQPIRKKAISDEIVDQLIDLISRNKLAPGERLPAERDLCRQFGVGRTTLREALRSLATLGIIEGRVGEGTFISEDSSRHLEKSLQWGLLLDEKDVEDLIETRLILECQTAEAAAERAGSDDIAAISETIKALEGALYNQTRFLESDLAFHLTIAQASQNRILANLLSLTRNYLQQWIVQSLDDPNFPEGERRAHLSLEEHQAILAAIDSKDSIAARERMRIHIVSSSRDLRRTAQS